MHTDADETVPLEDPTGMLADWDKSKCTYFLPYEATTIPRGRPRTNA